MCIPTVVGKEWYLLHQGCHIPFGTSAYIPEVSEWNQGEAQNTFNIRKGRWMFICSIKNYDHEIESFCEMVLEPIIDYSRAWDIKICTEDGMQVSVIGFTPGGKVRTVIDGFDY